MSKKQIAFLGVVVGLIDIFLLFKFGISALALFVFGKFTGAVIRAVLLYRVQVLADLLKVFKRR